MVVSGLSLRPSVNFTVSTVVYIALSLIGCLFANRKALAMRLT